MSSTKKNQKKNRTLINFPLRSTRRPVYRDIILLAMNSRELNEVFFLFYHQI